MTAQSPMVDWEYAVSVGARFAGDGPEVSPEEADQVVAELREDANRATGLVREYTGLDAPAGTAPLLVVDRDGWIRANAETFSQLLGPVTERLTEKKGGPGPLGRAVGSRVAGLEVGLLLGFMGSRVLGQFDPFPDARGQLAEPGITAPGRLLLVAPNVVHVERELGADPTDFRLWVCLHEETHRVQFTAVPWMREHLLGEVDALTEAVDPEHSLDDLLKRLAAGIRGGGSIMEAVSSPEQREIIDRLTGVMSLLEGHADVVMDGVGPSVIPSVRKIRKAFTKRRQGVGALDRILRRLLGVDAKMAQYRDGAAFVRAVVDKVGMDGFNAVWSGPEQLPSKAEIGDPEAWLTRVRP